MSILSSARSRYMSFPMAGDDAETWSREQLLEMNGRFTDRLEEAFKLGLESRASAANQVKLPATAGAVQVTPLCPAVWSGLLRSTASGAIMVIAQR
jgi:hypothetical protein